MRERGGVLRLAAEALDELLVVRVPVVQDLDRDAAAELLVLGEVDVRHPAGAELAHDLIAPVEERSDERVRDGHGGLYRVVGPSAGQQGLHDLLRDRGRDGAAEAVQLLLEHDGDRDLGVLRRARTR